MPASRPLPARLATLLLAATLAACTTPPDRPAAASVLTDAQIAAVIASPGRDASERTNDLRRKPADLLAFIGIRPGMTALDVSAGGGYTTELLARAIGPAGRVYAQVPPPNAARTPPAEPEGGPSNGPSDRRPPASFMPPSGLPGPAVAQRAIRLANSGEPAAPIVTLIQPFENPVPALPAGQGLDLVTLMFNYHDLGHLGVDRAQMNRAIYAALKPGGMYVIGDHAGRPGTGIGESGTLHRIEEAFLIQEVEAAGFRRAAEAGFLRNPGDPRDRNTPVPPQAKDDFVLKFVKP